MPGLEEVVYERVGWYVVWEQMVGQQMEGQCYWVLLLRVVQVEH